MSRDDPGAGAIGSTRPTARRPRPCSAERGLTRRRPRPRPRRAGSAPRASPSGPSSASTTTACSGDARRLASRPARRLHGAVHPGALAPGPGAARPRARGQHREVPRGRHAAGLIGLATLRRRGLAPGGDLFEARPSPSSIRRSPLHSCQRRTITSQYFGSSSTSRAWRPVFSQAIRVEPEPPNGSSTMSRLLLEFRIARSTSATGFMVGCRSFLRRLVDEPDVALVPGAAPVVIVPCRPAVEDRLILALVVGAAEGEGVSSPRSRRCDHLPPAAVNARCSVCSSDDDMQT